MTRFFILFFFHFTWDINVLLTFVVARVQLFEEKKKEEKQNSVHNISLFQF